MSKDRVQRVHPTAKSSKNDEGWWDIRAGDRLLGQGSTATAAWWDAFQALSPAEQRPWIKSEAPPPIPCWPFPVSSRKEFQSGRS